MHRSESARSTYAAITRSVVGVLEKFHPLHHLFRRPLPPGQVKSSTSPSRRGVRRLVLREAVLMSF